jgi:hypothetical protein
MKRAIAVATVGVLALWSVAHSGDYTGIAYYVASPVSKETVPRVQDHELREDRFVTEKGVTPIVRTADPVLEIPGDQIVKAAAYEVVEPVADSPRTWTVVRLAFSDGYRRRMDRLYSLYPEHYLLLRLNETFVDLEALGGYPSEGFPGGVFRTLEAATEAYEKVGVDVYVVKALPSQIEEEARFDREYRRAAMWFAKCDPETFAELRSEGIATIVGPVDEQEGWAAIDCDQGAPQFPPAPPGRPEVCTESSENGRLSDGERDGVWSVVNPYGQQIRLDYYREGELIRSVWLRDCGGKSR